MDQHHVYHYLIALMLAAAIAGTVEGVRVVNERVGQVERTARTALLQTPKTAQRNLPGSWEPLPRDKLHALVVQLTGVEDKPSVTLFCADPSCAEIATDLNDALQLAGWPVVRFERRPVDSEADPGISVGPKSSSVAVALVDALQAQGLRASLTEIDGIDGVGIIIGQSH